VGAVVSDQVAEQLLACGDGVDQGTRETELSGVDLARVALQSAREAARRHGADPATKRRSTTRQGHGFVRGEGREPVGLGGALSALMASRAWETPVAGGGVLADWPTIAPELAAHVAAVAHDAESGRLDLSPASPAWATQVRLTSASLIARIGHQVGPGVVRSIQVLPPGAAVGTAPALAAAASTATTPPAPAKPRQRCTGYELALQAHRATKTVGTAPPAVRAAIERQDAAMAREPEEAFNAALEERLRLEAEQRQAADVHRRALRRARTERAADQLPSITPSTTAVTGLGQTA
jgi:predicted nucleic acid-binding Zn ribbon protein